MIMNDKIRSMIDSNQFAERKKIVDAQMKGWDKGYDKGYEKGYRNGVAIGIAVCAGFYLLITLGQKVL